MKFLSAILSFSLLFLLAISETTSAPDSVAWSVTGIGGGGGQFTPAVSPHNPNLMFVSCDMSGFYRSTYPDASCPIEYKIVSWSSEGMSGSVAYAWNKWDENANQILLIVDPGFTGELCFSIQARNQCGESDVSEFCIDVSSSCTYSQSLTSPSNTANSIEVIDRKTNNKLVEIMPNPTSDYLKIIKTNLKYSPLIRIIDLNGIIIMEEYLNSSEKTMNLNSLSSGTYIVEATANGINETSLIVIEK